MNSLIQPGCLTVCNDLVVLKSITLKHLFLPDSPGFVKS